jgi:uncharacterized protein (TIGR03578 family)
MRSVEGVTAINEGATYWDSALWKKSSASAWCRPGKRNTALKHERAIHHHGESHGKGETKARAFADALNHVQAAVMKASPHILLRIEPQDVQVVQARESVRKEAFLFLFLRRERRTFSVELDVTVNVTAINLDKVDFVTQR